MVWVNSINDLDYYKRKPSDYCYCDLLLRPTDLAIQSKFADEVADSGNPALDLHIYLYTPDGLTNLGEITTSFDWYIAMQGYTTYFIAKLHAIPAIMCENKCFILRVVIPGINATPRFDKFTEQYCLHECCLLADSVSISGGGILTGGTDPVTTISEVDGMCRPIQRIEVIYECQDRFTGDYWNVPDNSAFMAGSVDANSMFAYSKVLNIAASKPRKLPRTIERQISLNCKVQRSETVRKYIMESYEMFPAWKSDEIESMLNANTLFINYGAYKFPGGTPFEPIYPEKLCKEYYRLKLPLEDCMQYQIFGCGEDCSRDNARYYAMRTEAMRFYDDSGRSIGNYDDLLIWLAGQPGVIEAVEVNPDTAITYDSIIKVTGTAPSFFYADGRYPANRIYAQKVTDGNYNALFGVDEHYRECNLPAIGVITFEDEECNEPVVGTITFDFYCNVPVAGSVDFDIITE